MKTKRRNWIPLYIAGRGSFSQPVAEVLERSDLPYMPGYLFDNSLSAEHCLYWIDDKTPIREYKKAIGPRLIWKHRLRFFTDLEEFTASSKPLQNQDEEFETAA